MQMIEKTTVFSVPQLGERKAAAGHNAARKGSAGGKADMGEV